MLGVTEDRDRRDIALLFATRSLRMFAYGFLAVVLVLYLGAVGLGGAEVGLLLALTLLGDAAISLLLTTRADRFGRRRTLFLGSLLMLGAGLVFASSTVFPVLLVAATLGVLSPSGNEVGPFLAIEQASLAQLVDAKDRTSTFARYQVAGSVATARGLAGRGPHHAGGARNRGRAGRRLPRRHRRLRRHRAGDGVHVPAADAAGRGGAPRPAGRR